LHQRDCIGPGAIAPRHLQRKLPLVVQAVKANDGRGRHVPRQRKLGGLSQAVVLLEIVECLLARLQ
jgi:hypothetical protein